MDDAQELELLALRSQLERSRTIQLRELEGMHSCLEGVDKGSCPYSGSEKDAWLMGYTQQETELSNAAMSVALRQALKNQIISVKDHLDIEAVIAENPERWWLDFATEESIAAFYGNPKNIKLFENVLKSAIAIVSKRAFSFSPEGILVDNEKAELFDELNDAVEQFLEYKNT